MYRLGIDGGGSRCRIRLCHASGIVLAAGEGGAANVSLDFAGALATIRGLVAEALRSAGLDEAALASTRVGLGLAGASSREIAARVEAALPIFEAIAVDHDGVAACLGAHAGRDGGIVIAGTGSVAVLREGGRATSIGGRGFHLGDDGSGAWIGREAWRRALRAFDGLDPPSAFTDALLDEHRRDPVAVIAWGRTAPSSSFAAYAPKVFDAVAHGDAVAEQIVRQAASSIAELVDALARRGAERIALVGGMAGAMAPHLTSATSALLSPALADALTGAMLLAETRPGRGG